MDVFDSYERGLEELLRRLGKDHPRDTEALTLQTRLLENIAQARRYGDTETRRAERAQIIEALNNLSLQAFGESFTEITTEGMDNSGPRRLLSQTQEVSDRLRGVKRYLRGAYCFPPKQVVEELFLVMEQTAQFIERVREDSNCDHLSLRLRINELVAKADGRLQYCRT